MKKRRFIGKILMIAVVLVMIGAMHGGVLASLGRADAGPAVTNSLSEHRDDHYGSDTGEEGIGLIRSVKRGEVGSDSLMGLSEDYFVGETLSAEPVLAFFSNRDGNAEIYTMNSDGSKQTRITDNPANDWDPSWSPDGRRIVFQSWRDGNAEIYVMNADGSNQVNVTNNPAEDSHPDWSPDGTKIVFSSNRHDPGGNCDIYVMNADGSNPTNLTNSSGHDWYASWSPDGTQIAFSSNRDGNFKVYVMNADGGNLRRLTSNSHCSQPTWSPDATRIAFTHVSWGSRHIYVMPAGGGSWKQLTTGYSEDNRDPNWFPGEKIAYASNRAGNFEIYVINSDGSGRVRLTSNSANDFHPAWAPTASITPEVLKVAYIPVEFPDQPSSLQVRELEERARAVELYFFSQSYCRVRIESEFILDKDGAHILHPFRYKDFDSYADDPGTPLAIARMLLVDEEEIASFADYLKGLKTRYVRSLLITAEVLRMEDVGINYSFDLSHGFTFEDYDTVVILQPPKLLPLGPISLNPGFSWLGFCYTSEQESFSTWAHELGHALFGWSDYYGGISGDVGLWGLMGYGWLMNPPSMVTSFNKVRAGWLTYNATSSEQEIPLLHELMAGDSVYEYYAADGDATRFIFEGRQPDVEQPLMDPIHGRGLINLNPSKGIMIYQVTEAGKTYSLGPQNALINFPPRVTLIPGEVYKHFPSETEFAAREETSTLYLDTRPFRPAGYKLFYLGDVSVVVDLSAIEQTTIALYPECYFDVDLRVHTRDARMTGLDYETMEYRTDIAGAYASGPVLGGGPEWIAVPDHEEVYLAIDPTPARRWTEAFGIDLTSIDVEIVAAYFDDEGARTQGEPVTLTIGLDRPLYLTVKDAEIRLLADVKIDPDTINLRARGQWISAYIELPEGYAAADADIGTVGLAYGEEEPLVADWGEVQDVVLMVKFDRATVATWLEGRHDEEVELTVVGAVNGIRFQGTATIRVTDLPRPGRGR